MAKLLELLAPGERARVLAVHASEDLRRRLVALGLKPGNLIQMVRKGWFAGPLQVRIGTTDIIIRRRDARLIEILPEISPELSSTHGSVPGRT